MTRQHFAHWDIATGKRKSTPVSDPKWVHTFALAPDGKELAISFGQSGHVEVWDLTIGKPTRRIYPHGAMKDGEVFDSFVSAYSPCGRYFATNCSHVGMVAIWRRSDDQLLDAWKAEKKSFLSTFCFSSNGNLVAKAELPAGEASEWSVVVQETLSGKVISTLTCKEFENGVDQLLFLPGTRQLAVVSEPIPPPPVF